MIIQFIRHATLLLNINGKNILVDPMLSSKGSLDAIENVPNKSKNPLVDLPVSIDSIIDCDAVLITHMHRDHFDNVAMEKLPLDMTIFCQPPDLETLNKLGFTNVLSIDSSIEWNDITINRTNGKHGHGIIAQKMAPVSGFIISAANEPKVYIAGDTVWYSHIKSNLLTYKPEIIISNCGEAKFSSGRNITMNAKDILSICQTSPESKVMAIHMESWNHCRLTRNDLINFLKEQGIQRQVLVPADGEIMNF